jgi:SseB protein N-terminal domain
MARPSDERALMTAVSAARLLVPVVAAAAEVTGGGAGGLRAETSTDMASITLTSPDGQRALPVFTSITTLAAWDPSARPVPVTAARAAQAAVSDRCDVLVVDLGADAPLVLRPSMVWALAQQRPWLPAADDPFVLEAVRRAAESEPDVLAVSVEEGQPAGAGILRVVLSIRPGLDAALVRAVATRMGERFATDGETRARIDGLSFAIRSA